MDRSTSPRSKKSVMTKSQSATHLKKFGIANGFDSSAIRTSFGKLPLGHEKSSPSFGFGSSSRFECGKRHMGTENVTHLIGTNSPGPAYSFSDSFKYKNSSNVKFGQSRRQDLMSGPTYEYYNHDTSFESPVKAADFVLRKPQCVKFGTTRRMRVDTVDSSPGPIYQYDDMMLRTKAHGATLGVRRDNGDSPLKVATSTTKLVGPGRYSPDQNRVRDSSPKFSLTKCPRIPRIKRPDDQNQTYVDYSSFGKQTTSLKKSSGGATFGNGKKDDNRGFFKHQMVTFSQSVKLPHVNQLGEKHSSPSSSASIQPF